MEHEKIDNYQVLQKKAGSRVRVLLLVAIVTTTSAVLIAVAYFRDRRAGESLPRSFETGVFSQETTIMGKSIHIESSRPPLTVEQISEFEKEIGGRLPDDYKQFRNTSAV